MSGLQGISAATTACREVKGSKKFGKLLEVGVCVCMSLCIVKSIDKNVLHILQIGHIGKTHMYI